MKIVKMLSFSLMLAAVLSAGCATAKKNLSYSPDWGDVTRINRPVVGVLLPVSDQRANTRVYPKQIIIRTNHGGYKSYDINDRPVDEVFGEAFSAEIEKMGVKLIHPADMEGPLDKESAEGMKKALNAKYPDAGVAFGVNIKEFVATSQRKLFRDQVKITADIELYTLDLGTGDIGSSEFTTEWVDALYSADHNYMVEQLDKALANLVLKGVRDNMTMRDMLVKIANR